MTDEHIPEITISFEPPYKLHKQPKISTSKDAYRLLVKLFNPVSFSVKEEAIVVYLNQRKRVIGYYKLSTGGLTETILDIRLIASIALKCLASAVILAHNHPSGEKQPSRNDKDATLKLKQALKLIDVVLMEHIVLTKNAYYSFSDKGEL